MKRHQIIRYSKPPLTLFLIDERQLIFLISVGAHPTGKESAYSIKEGWLTKQGNYIKNWRPRWFQLKDGVLNYYKEPTVETKPTNYFYLMGCKFQPCEKYGPGCFEMIMANGEKRYMQAPTKEERDDWIRLLNESCRTMNRKEENFKDGMQKLTPEDFNFVKVLGKGNYGKVMLATLKKDGKEEEDREGNAIYYAVKVIKKSGLIDDESLEHVLSENRVLQNMSHPYLVKLYYSFQTKDRLFFVMEYIKGGELFFHIGREKRFSEERTRLYAAEILLALSYLHSKGIVYRDLKLENILLDHEGHIKITDFGLCKEGIGIDRQSTNTFCGTPEYLAPEILEEENYGKSVDWWALGVVMYELMIGRPPFGPANNMEKLFHNILHQDVFIPSFLTPEAVSVLRQLLCRDYTKRLGCGASGSDEIQKHPFFQGIDWKKLIARQVPAFFVPEIRSEQDVRNFDREFTELPAIITPGTEASSELLMHKTSFNIKDFTFVAGNHLKSQ